MPPVIIAGRTGTTDPQEVTSQSLQLLGITQDGALIPAAVDENMRRLRDFIDQRTVPVGGIDALARLVGGQILQATVGVSSSTDRFMDTAVTHRLKRIPTCIVWQQLVVPPNDGRVAAGSYPAITGILAGHPSGNWGTRGGNQQAWTETLVYLRASEAATYRFIIT